MRVKSQTPQHAETGPRKFVRSLRPIPSRPLRFLVVFDPVSCHSLPPTALQRRRRKKTLPSRPQRSVQTSHEVAPRAELVRKRKSALREEFSDEAEIQIRPLADGGGGCEPAKDKQARGRARDPASLHGSRYCGSPLLS